MKFKFFTAWYDVWIGVYYDRKRKVLYIGFPPCCIWSFASDMNIWSNGFHKWQHLIYDRDMMVPYGGD